MHVSLTSVCFFCVLPACRYMDRKMLVKLNGNREVTGVLRGFDQFMNIVLDDTVEEKTGEACGMVVRPRFPPALPSRCVLSLADPRPPRVAARRSSGEAA